MLLRVLGAGQHGDIAWIEYLLVLVVVLPLIAVAESLAPESGSAAVRARPRPVRADWTWLAVVIVAAPAVMAATVVAAGALARHGAAPGWFRGHAVAAAIVGGLVAELAGYWAHRGEHRLAMLWPLHRAHHGATHLDALRGLRSHPLDLVWTRGLPVLAAALAGIGPDRLTPYLSVLFVVSVLAHADLEVPPTWSRLVVTPGYHRTHHDVRHCGANLAMVLPVLDRLFGTAAIGERPRCFAGAPSQPGEHAHGQ